MMDNELSLPMGEFIFLVCFMHTSCSKLTNCYISGSTLSTMAPGEASQTSLVQIMHVLVILNQYYKMHFSCILISDLVVANLSKRSFLTLLGCTFFTPKVFLHEIYSYLQINDYQLPALATVLTSLPRLDFPGGPWPTQMFAIINCQTI